MLCIAWSSCLDIGMVLHDDIKCHQGAWVGDQFNMRLHNDVAQYMTLDGCVDVTLELRKEIFMIGRANVNLKGCLKNNLTVPCMNVEGSGQS